MLKRLELVGFKSFADKTTFDFGEGVTAIVGPNGSGKSNIVDAVRWLLGEQSAKSLRGGEMADVIFNGSASRRSLGLAEVTMTFDNRKRALNIESEEVQIGRRVYRSGEGEYLINQQICRLRDIKELFLGSGAGADAYSIIEQGRVDVLLQASTYDRRTIFEEAAGISRFKAKKVETLRKLERVDQNLQRLKDIIDEVEKQLRSVKLQASKAQRYQEYSARLKELRIALGLHEYQQLSEKLQAEGAVVEKLKAALAEQAARASGWEAEMQRLEAVLAKVDEGLHEQEAHLAQAREQIKAGETTLGHEWSSAASLDTELARSRTRAVELAAHHGQLAAAAERARSALLQAEEQAAQQRATVRGLEASVKGTAEAITALRNQTTAAKSDHLEQMRRTAHLQNDAVSYKAQVDNLTRERERLRLKTEQATESLASLDVELQELTAADSALQTKLQTARQALAALRQERDRLQNLRDETADTISKLRQDRSGVASRLEMLEGLERSHEGLGTGVREVLEIVGQTPAGPWRTVVGMIADFLTVRREYAPLIDLALGDLSQHFLVRDANLLAKALAARPQPFSGRVSFLPLTETAASARSAPNSAESAATLPPHPSVIAPAHTLVTCDNPELADLPRLLLGNTLVVKDLDAARAIAAHASGHRFVTLQGELLEPDGTLTVGTHHAETGILSRKSELRELRVKLTVLERRIADTERKLADLREQLARLEGRDATQQEEIEVLAEQGADLRARVEQHRNQRQGLHEEVSLSLDEIGRMAQEIDKLDKSWHQAQTQAATAEAEVHDLQQRIERTELEIRQREQDRQQRQQEATTAAVALAKAEERLAGLRTQHDQVAADLQRRHQEAAQAEQSLHDCKTRLEHSQLAMLNASAAIALWSREKEIAEGQVAQLTDQRTTLRQERLKLATQAQAVRNDWRTQQEQAHVRELELNDLRHRRDTLVDRLREDYQIGFRQSAFGNRQPAAGNLPETVDNNGQPLPFEQLADSRQPIADSRKPTADCRLPEAIDSDGQPLSIEPIAESRRPEAEEEITELRRKLSKLGSVNLDALEELRKLETRASTLHEQFEDLASAKRSLEEIIAKINQDSQRLFQEVFTTIRTHFQELFRKLFGGGMADIVLEDENDVLESGIEVIARPPGKELRSISLMSGGEKTMTAVALLLAVFRSKPSPFCLLDEVDAALDEANIGRFTAVLHDFLDLSQFIIITHSKKTMACADVLYGITMQESGISKRVAVRFEDWPDDAKLAAEPAANEHGNGATTKAESFAGR